MNPDEPQQPINDDPANPVQAAGQTQVPTEESLNQYQNHTPQPTTFQIPPNESSNQQPSSIPQPVERVDNDLPIFVQEEHSPAVTPPPIVETPVPTASPTPEFNSQPTTSEPTSPQTQPIQSYFQDESDSVTTIPDNIVPNRPNKSNIFRVLAFSLIGLTIIGLIIGAIVLLVGSSDNQDSGSELSTRIYESSTLKFTTQIPEDWIDQEPDEAGLSIAEFTHPTLREDGSPIASVAILRLIDLEEQEDATEFYDFFETRLAEGFDTYEQTASEEITVDAMQAKRIEANVTEDGLEEKATFYLVYGVSYGYVISQSVLETDESEVNEDFKLIVDNFDSALNNSETEE